LQFWIGPLDRLKVKWPMVPLKALGL
jgi:hypothetical protein